MLQLMNQKNQTQINTSQVGDAAITTDTKGQNTSNQAQISGEKVAKEGDSDSDSGSLDEDLLAPSDYQVKLVRDEQPPPLHASQDTQVTQKKKRISKHARKQMKKPDKVTQQIQKPKQQEKKEPATKEALPQQLSKRQKNKLKKRQKYALQDEEERELAMKLLGIQKSKDEPQGEKQQTEEQKNDTQTPQETKIADKERMKKQTAKKLQEEQDLRLKEENEEELTAEDEQKLASMRTKGLGVDLSVLTGNPVPEDTLLYAVPISAPYSTLTNYKYKVKLTPGSLKKGKASKQAISLFLSNPNATDIERDLIKATPDNELISAILSNVKISAPGLNAKTQKSKKKR